MKTILLQAGLDHLGYDVGPLDGDSGPKTRSAVTAFQGDFGITADGVAGPETEKALFHALAYGMEKKPSVTKQETSKAVNGWGDLKYISRAEFKCKCGGKYCNGFPVEPSLATAKIDEQIRAHFGRPLTITSGIRCEKHNAEEGGVSGSEHTKGIATDIQVQGVAPETVAAYAETLMPNYGGIGIYRWGVHIDTRSVKARWRG